MTWKMSAGQRKTEIWRSEEKKTEGEQDKDRRQRGRSRDNKEDVIPASLLQHPFSLHSLIVSFLLFALPLIFFFLLFILSLFVSVISFYLSVSLAFCCSDTQTNEPWNIRHQDTGRVFWVCICVWEAGCAHACVCVCVRSFWLWLWSLSGLLAALEGSPPVFFDPTSEIQKNNLAGTKSNWPLKIVNSLAAAQLTSQGERMFHGDRSQKIHEETRQEKMQKNGF